MKSITAEINALRVMKMPELVARYEELFGKPPRVKHKEYLWKRVAWKIQEQRFGGLPAAARRRLDELIAEVELPIDQNKQTVAGQLKRKPTPGDPIPGTSLVRVWRDQEYRVRVTDDGYEHDGVVYRSLSAVAKAITGSHWNGRLFFGLRKRGNK